MVFFVCLGVLDYLFLYGYLIYYVIVLGISCFIYASHYLGSMVYMLRFGITTVSNFVYSGGIAVGFY